MSNEQLLSQIFDLTDILDNASICRFRQPETYIVIASLTKVRRGNLLKQFLNEHMRV